MLHFAGCPSQDSGRDTPKVPGAATGGARARLGTHGSDIRHSARSNLLSIDGDGADQLSLFEHRHIEKSSRTGRFFREALGASLAPAVLDRDGAALDPATL